MNQINFLPESYGRAQKRRGRLLRQIALVSSIAGCLVVATVALKANNMNQRHNAERLEQTVEAEQGALGVISGIEKKHASLVKRAELKNSLMPPVNYHQALGALSQTMPAEVAVTELIMTSVRPKPEPIETDAEREARLKRQANPTNEPPPYEPYLIGIELEALAPDDLAVASFVAALDESPLFSRVTMRSSRAVVSNGLQARRFSLTATIDLDRDFRWLDENPEVAHVD